MKKLSWFYVIVMFVFGFTLGNHASADGDMSGMASQRMQVSQLGQQNGNIEPQYKYCEVLNKWVENPNYKGNGNPDPEKSTSKNIYGGG